MQTDPTSPTTCCCADGDIALLDYGAVRELPAPLSRALCGGSSAPAWRTTARRCARRCSRSASSPPHERADRVEALLDLFLIGCEPFRHRGVYDFGASDVPARAREPGMELTFGRASCARRRRRPSSCTASSAAPSCSAPASARASTCAACCSPSSATRLAAVSLDQTDASAAASPGTHCPALEPLLGCRGVMRESGSSAPTPQHPTAPPSDAVGELSGKRGGKVVGC